MVSAIYVDKCKNRTGFADDNGFAYFSRKKSRASRRLIQKLDKNLQDSVKTIVFQQVIESVDFNYDKAVINFWCKPPKPPFDMITTASPSPASFTTRAMISSSERLTSALFDDAEMTGCKSQSKPSG